MIPERHSLHTITTAILDILPPWVLCSSTSMAISGCMILGAPVECQRGAELTRGQVRAERHQPSDTEAPNHATPVPQAE
jgi:hypothetical protein